MLDTIKRNPVTIIVVAVVAAIVGVAFLAKPIGKLFGYATKVPVVGTLLAKASAAANR